MRSCDIKKKMTEAGQLVSLGKLCDRVLSPGRANWKDLPSYSGVYAVCLDGWQDLQFTDNPVPGILAKIDPVCMLIKRRNRIREPGTTDILYIGKSKNLRKRLRQLARFGAKRTRKHAGGRWLWQIVGIRNASVWIWPYDDETPEKLEQRLLDRFKCEHDIWPLANKRR